MAAVLADNPLVYYRFDETVGTTAENRGQLGQAADGTYSLVGVALGEVSAFPGLGRAVGLDGASGAVQVPNLGVGPLPAVSVELWLNRQGDPVDFSALYAGDGWAAGWLHLTWLRGIPPWNLPCMATLKPRALVQLGQPTNGIIW